MREPAVIADLLELPNSPAEQLSHRIVLRRHMTARQNPEYLAQAQKHRETYESEWLCDASPA